MRFLSWLALTSALLAVSTPKVVRAEGGSDLALKMETEVTGYQDSDATSVLTPGIRADLEGVTDGWNVGAGFLVDVVTAASADVVATASPKWTDVRYVPSLDGRFKIDDVTVSLGGGASIESDYIAGSGSLGLAIDLAAKTITPSFSYGFGYDIAGRRGTPYSVYKLEVQRHAMTAAVSFVVNKSTIFVPSLSAVIELGDQEKPYRYLPTFLEGGAEVPAGASRDEVDLARTSVRLAENSPDLRHRYAGAALVAHRFDNATVRVEQRFYGDNWLLLASTTDFLLPIDATTSFRVWPHARLHVQKGVSFWRSDYRVTLDPTGNVLTGPQLRVGDRELGPMLAATLGAGFRVGSDAFGFSVNADAIYTRFLDHLFIQDRIAGFGGVTFDAKVD
jgi:hypothetical protein